LNRGATVHSGDPGGFKEWCLKTFGLELDLALAAKATEPDEADPGPVLELLEARHQSREEELGEELTRRVEQYLILNAIDGRWKDHLKAVDALKAGIGLRGYGQEDPKTAYKREGTTMFQEQLLPAIEDEVASLLLRIEVRRPDESDQGSEPGTAQGDALQPRGMVQGGQVGLGQSILPGAQNLSPQQIQELQRRARAQVAQQSMRGRVPASGAFDMMRRQKAASEQQQVAGTQPSQSGQKPLAAPAETFPGTGRNDPCPCGSGKKFKKCHGS
jgi:preprotein translocase subunit SecA